MLVMLSAWPLRGSPNCWNDHASHIYACQRILHISTVICLHILGLRVEFRFAICSKQIAWSKGEVSVKCDFAKVKEVGE